MMNCVTKIAAANGRDYITPNDVSDALKTNDRDKVRLAVLAVLAGCVFTGELFHGIKKTFYAEDSRCCAFVAHSAKKRRRLN